jgi:diguanylate cyclase (GGDEF)-like protein
MDDRMLNRAQHGRRRFFIAFGSLIVYALVFLALYPVVGRAGAVLTVLPAVVFGWFLGVRGGIFFGVLAMPLNTLLFQLVGNTQASELAPNLLGSIANGFVSTGIGWIKTLNQQIRQQAEALQTERALLQEEIARRTRAEAQLIYEAHHDPLTNLPNRRLLLDRLEHAIAWSKRNPGELCAVLYLDLNRFKIINDSLGHEAGDHLLIAVASRLKASVRDIDTIARMGGDEFAIVLENAGTPADVITIIQRILANLALPYEWNGNAIVSGASMGVVMSMSLYEGIDAILRDADSAMYQAKASGSSGFRIFADGMRIQSETTRAKTESP